jgi:16S rRNA processing protein RimM
MNDAETLRGLEVVVPSDERVPLEDDAVYIDDLIGCRVIDQESEPEIAVGEIIDVERGLGGAPDLLVVRPVANAAATTQPVPEPAVTGDRPRRGKRAKKIPELLIPFAKKYLVSVDIAEKRVVMRLPAGLTELNADSSAEQPEGDEG